MKAGLDEMQKRVTDALEAGVEAPVIKQYEGVLKQLNDMTDEEILELRQRDGNPDYDVIKQRRQSGIESIAYSYKDEYIETLKSQMTDLRIQINDNMKRLDEKDEYIAILKRENERLLNENERLRVALSESQSDDLIRKFPFHMGSAEQGLKEQPKI